MRLLCVLLGTFGGLFFLVACQPSSQAEEVPSPLQHEVDSAQVVVADTTVPATDGGEVAMARVRQRALIEEDSLWAEALRIHYNAIVMDGHIDTPLLMLDEGYRFPVRHRISAGDVDLPRMFSGGLDAAFFSIYVAAGYGEGGAAVERARSMMGELKRQLTASGDSVALAYSAGDVRRLARQGKKGVLMGLEGGHALARSVDTLRMFYEKGIRYVTLTHVNTNSWADASQSLPRWDGLTAKGRQLVRAMNRLGMLVDLSHVSDSTFYDALSVTKAPPILSHSSSRALVNSVRNVSDDMLRALAEKGGVIMINFFDPMVNDALTDDVMDEVYRRIEASGTSLRRFWYVVYDVKQERGLPDASVEDVLDHIDHVVEVAGIDHVGLGSDFDGVNDLPTGLHDVARLPWITYGLLKRGYTEEEIYKILGGNALRVLEEAERIAAQQAKS